MAKYQTKPQWVEAFYIDERTRTTDEDPLGPNATSIAAAVGWLMGRGVSDIATHGSSAPYGLQVSSEVTEAGEWLVCRWVETSSGYHYRVQTMSDEAFRSQYVVADEG